MEAQFTTIGAIIGLVIAIVLIIRKVQPAYSLILGALIGGLIGGGGLATTVSTMVSGAGSMMSSILRILTSGILAGALIKTGSEEKISEKYDVIILHASLPAKNIYLKRGFREVDYLKIDTGYGDFLCADVMEKKAK